jgi:hypothetical protein
MNQYLRCATALIAAALVAGCASTTMVDTSGTVAGSGTSAACDTQAAQTAAAALDNAAAPMYGCGVMLPR